MNRIVTSGFVLSLVAILIPGSAFAVQTQPAPATAGSQSLQATIVNLKGKVQVRQGDDQAWAKAEIGMKVNELAEFRTGPNSAVQLTIPPDQTITLDRLGDLKLLEAVNDNGIPKTSVGMKYGRTRFDIEAEGRPHEASISSPSSVLAVRGTIFSSYDQRPFPAEAVSLSGRVDFRDHTKQVQFGNKGQGKTKVNVNADSTAALALADSTLDPSFTLARSGAEAPLIERIISNGSTVFFDRNAGIKVVTGGTPPNDQQLIPVLPGVLNIVARWHIDSDLNLSLSTPGGANNGGQLLYPVGALATNSSGGHVAFDHRGGPNGGIEVIYFPKIPADGLYAIGLTLVSGPATVAQVDAFENGKRIGIFDGHQTVQSVTTTVPVPIPGVQGTAVGILPIGFNFPFSTPATATTDAKAAAGKSPTQTQTSKGTPPAKISQTVNGPVAPAAKKR